MFGNIQFVDHPDLENVRKLDLLAVPIVRRMMRLGMPVNVDKLRQLSSDFEARKNSIRAEIIDEIPVRVLEAVCAENDDDFNIGSSDQVAELLFDHLRIGRGRNLKRTSTGRVSTGKKQLELLAEDVPLIRRILDYRELAKLKSTYADALPKRAILHPRGDCAICGFHHRSPSHRIHNDILLTRTATGRLATKNPNLQNIPMRSELGRMIRSAFEAPEGRLLVKVDFSQIELRLLAHCASESAMQQIFRDGLDIHTATAARVFNVPLDQVDKLTQRLPCKNVNFMVVYGATWRGLQLQLALSGLNWTGEECDRFIADWFTAYSAVRPYMDEQYRQARQFERVWDLFGRSRGVPEVRSVHERVRAQGLRQAGNHRIQATAAGMMRLFMAEAFAMDTCGDPLMSIHDELLCETDEEDAENVAKWLVAIAEGCCELSVPLLADARIGQEWEKAV